MKSWIKAIVKKIKHSLGEALIQAYCLVCNREIERNKVFVMTFDNRYSCNPKAIISELLSRNRDLKIVWTYTGSEEEARKRFPEGITLVRRGSLQMIREQLSSKVWLDNGINCLWFGVPKKKDQIYINTWHGSLGIKKYSGDETWLRIAAKAADTTDYCITNSTFEESVFRDNLWPNSQMLPFGHARNDILFRTEEHYRIRESICKQLGVPFEKKMFLYAPTFRDDHNTSWMTLDFSRLRNNLEKRFGGKWVILLRFHFKDRDNTCWKKGHESEYINASGISDMYQLMIASDAGCSDYSSWSYDYLLLDRPSFLFLPDLSEYDEERGFTYPIMTTPFPKAKDNDEMEDIVIKYDADAFSKAKEAFLKEKGCYEDGKAASRAADFIESKTH